MGIRKATQNDLLEYVKLRKEDILEYSKIVNEKVTSDDEKLKKEFNGLMNSKDNIIIVAEDENNLIGYLNGSLLNNIWQESGYIDDLFVTREFKRKGIGTQLIKKFIEYLKVKKIKKCKLGVDIKNINAISLYNKLGFKTDHYEMSLNI